MSPYQEATASSTSSLIWGLRDLPKWWSDRLGHGAFLEIFGSVCAAAADYRQIIYRPSIPAGASKDFINEYNNTSQFCSSLRIISCSEFFFHIFHFLYIFKTNGTELIDESADVCSHFSGHVTSQAFERVLSFCWNSRCMYFL